MSVTYYELSIEYGVSEVRCFNSYEDLILIVNELPKQ